MQYSSERRIDQLGELLPSLTYAHTLCAVDGMREQLLDVQFQHADKPGLLSCRCAEYQPSAGYEVYGCPELVNVNATIDSNTFLVYFKCPNNTSSIPLYLALLFCPLCPFLYKNLLLTVTDQLFSLLCLPLHLFHPPPYIFLLPISSRPLPLSAFYITHIPFPLLHARSVTFPDTSLISLSLTHSVFQSEIIFSYHRFPLLLTPEPLPVLRLIWSLSLHLSLTTFPSLPCLHRYLFSQRLPNSLLYHV